MLPISTKEIIEITPDDESGVIYKIKVPTLLDKIKFQKDLAAAGARFPTDNMIRNSARDAIKVLVETEQQAELLEIIDSIEAVEKGAEVDVKLSEDYSELLSQLRERWSELADLLADRLVWFDLYCFCAARLFLVGIENGAPFKKSGFSLSEETLRRIPSAHLGFIGAEFSKLINLSERDEKNLKPQSPLQQPQSNSIAENTPPMVEKSEPMEESSAGNSVG